MECAALDVECEEASDEAESKVASLELCGAAGGGGDGCGTYDFALKSLRVQGPVYTHSSWPQRSDYTLSPYPQT